MAIVESNEYVVTVFQNANGDIVIKQIEEEETAYQSGFVVVDKRDIAELIRALECFK